MAELRERIDDALANLVLAGIEEKQLLQGGTALARDAGREKQVHESVNQ
jgi:hypothetical protein